MLTDQEFLLKHARHPSHAGSVAEMELQGACKNPLCGDSVEVGLSLEGDVIREIRIQASGCGISTASASLMSEVVEGLEADEALRRLELFNASLLSKGEWPQELRDLKPFARLRESPTRVPCALIGWFAFKDALVKR